MPTGTVTLTYGLWTSHFAADPAVVGWSIRINGETYSVTGVLPRDFVLPMRKVSLLVPFSFTAAQRSNQGAATSSAKSCATAASRLGQLNAQMETIVNHLIDRVPGTRRLLPEERIYLSAEQTPLNSMGLVAKTAMEPSSIVSQARGAVQAMDPEQATRRCGRWTRDLTLGGHRTPMTLLTQFGAIALILWAIGINGVLAFGVAQRARELAIRQALGADRGSILPLVLGQGLRTAGSGIVAGAVAASILSQYMK